MTPWSKNVAFYNSIYLVPSSNAPKYTFFYLSKQPKFMAKKLSYSGTLTALSQCDCFQKKNCREISSKLLNALRECFSS